MSIFFSKIGFIVFTTTHFFIGCLVYSLRFWPCSNSLTTTANLRFSLKSVKTKYKNMELSAYFLQNPLATPEQLQAEMVYRVAFFHFQTVEPYTGDGEKWPTGFQTQFKALCRRAFIQNNKLILDRFGFGQVS